MAHPIWPNCANVATWCFRKLADSLVPEVDHVHQLSDKVSEILNKTQPSIDKIPSSLAQLSIEMLVLIGLPLMRFSEDPLTYSD